MKISFRLRQLLGADAGKRGVIKAIERKTRIERHTISALLNNEKNSLNIETLSKLCDFLIAEGYAPAESLPGALFGSDPERFWDLLASCERVEFCLGARRASEWPGTDYVISTDSHFQGVLLSKISQLKYGSDTHTQPNRGKALGGPPVPRTNAEPPATGERLLSAFHLVNAPRRHARPDDPGEGWEQLRRRADEVVGGLRRYRDKRVLIALGSIKVNPVVEIMLADAFSASPFVVQDGVGDASQRLCPIFFRYRDDDPQPPSCCGGTTLATQPDSQRSGIYCEAEGGGWVCFPWEKDHDAAFIFYANKRAAGLVEVACGGFSARATGLMIEYLEPIASRLGDPQYEAHDLHLGLYVVRFTRRVSERSVGCEPRNADWGFEVVPIPEFTIRRRLDAAPNGSPHALAHGNGHSRAPVEAA
jgi:hypothetical protein